MEIRRLSTNKKHRNLGIASKLMNRIDKCAFELDCETLYAETACVQYDAVNFYASKQERVDKVNKF